MNRLKTQSLVAQAQLGFPWSEDLKIILSGVAFGLILLTALPGQYMRQSVAAILGGGLIGVVGVVGILLRVRASSLKSLISTKNFIFPILFGALLTHDLIDSYKLEGLNSGLSFIASKILIYVAMIICALPWIGIGKQNLVMAIVAIGLGVYSGINVIAYQIFGLSGLTNGSLELSTAVVLGVSYERMIAPFSEGLNNFGIYASIGFCISILLLSNRQIWGRPILATVLIIGLYATALATYLVQIRSAILIVIETLIWMTLTGRNSYQIFLWGTFSIYLIGVPVYMYIYEDSTLTNLTTLVPYFLERTGEDFLALSGRVYIWDYALDLLASGQVPIEGLGNATRDMTPAYAISGAKYGTAGMTCHNGFLDLVCVYGPVLSTVAAISISLLINRLLRRCVDDCGFMIYLSLGIVASLLWSAFLESTSGIPLFWGVITLLACDSYLNTEDSLTRMSLLKPHENES